MYAVVNTVATKNIDNPEIIRFEQQSLDLLS